MKKFLVLAFYNLLLPVVFILAFPGWVLKMKKRGGFGTGLLERLGLFKRHISEERQGGVYVHAVSVGEVMIALKLIKKWSELFPEQHFILVPTTATGHAVAIKSASDRIRVIYSPVDFWFTVRSVLDRFQPSQVVLIEAETWPNLLYACEQRNIEVSVANTRLSTRSEGRFHQLRFLVQPIFRMVTRFLVQELADVARWKELGVDQERVIHTGSIKFDTEGGAQPTQRQEFLEILNDIGVGKKVVMAMSTFPGEEAAIASALSSCSDILLVFVPRHMERRHEVVADLKAAGYAPVLRSEMQLTPSDKPHCLVVDSTGELRDWTAHADIAIIGKSWLEKGGQNPAEAIAAGVPVITGKRMDNFEPLISSLVSKNAIVKLEEVDELKEVVDRFMSDSELVMGMVGKACSVLGSHAGATERSIAVLQAN